ncbi:MAG TPA: hypothetical protein EYG79_01510 [Rhodobacteraceae bacterium]|nr:hypothetical protein [Paracoccaceae bacterium]
MKKAALALIASTMILSACASVEQTAANREVHMANLLPNPADREGIFLIFPVSNSILVKYFPGQVSEAQIMRRVAPICANPVHSNEPTTASEATLADGTVVNTRSFVIKCMGA